METIDTSQAIQEQSWSMISRITRQNLWSHQNKVWRHGFREKKQIKET